MPKVRRTHNIANGASAIRSNQFSFHCVLPRLFFILMYVTNVIAVLRKTKDGREREGEGCAIYLNQLEDDVNDANESEKTDLQYL